MINNQRDKPQKNKSKPKKQFGLGHFAQIAAKVTLVTLAGFLTIYTIHFAINKAFEKITTNIDELAKPNERLILVNDVFRNISKLNNVIHEESVSGRQNLSVSYTEFSETIANQIDSLSTLFENDIAQQERLNIIKDNLKIQETVLNEFLKIQHEYGLNNNLKKILSNINKEKPTQTDITTSSEEPENSEVEDEQKKGLLRRIFKKKEKSDELEDIELAAERQKVDSLKTEATYTRKKIDIIEQSIATHSNRTRQLSSLVQKKQFELLQTNNFLYQEVISIINEVEQEELAQQQAKTTDSFITAGNTIKHLNTVAATFIGTSLILFLLIIVDLSNSNKYRKRLEIATETERNEAKAKQHFLSNMSHEIRTPLQSIYGYTEQAMLSPEKPININAIYNSAAHLLDIVNEVLDFSLISSGKINLTSEPFIPNEQINSVIEAMKPQCKNKNLECTYINNLPENLIIKGDPFRLKQILFNMIGNAIKFTDQGYIKLSSSYLNEKIIIEIEDTGIGIDKIQLPKLFQEYTQTDPTIINKYGGTGLGLSIVKKIVDIQNGEITVKSEVNKGTKFTIAIPYTRTESIDTETTSNRLELNKNFDKKVYVADDDRLILKLFSTIFQKYNIPHKTFENGNELIEIYKKEKADIVFLDMRMPKISGDKVCKMLRAITPDKKQLEIYALTAQTYTKEHYNELVNNGYNHLINKPFLESQILEVLNNSNTKKRETQRPSHADINLNPFIKFGYDSSEIIELIDTIIIETKKDLENIKEAIGDKNVDDTTLILHKLAGRIGQIGEKELSARIRNKEITIKNNQSINDNFDSIIKDIYMFVEKITIEKDKLSAK